MTRSPALPWILFAAIAFLYIFRLNAPEKIYYDEVYHVTTAREFVTLKGNYENTHPPFGKTLMALSIKVFGDKPWAWRLFPVLAGIGLILVFQRIAKRILQNENFAWAAAYLFALDGIAITQARIAMLNSLMLFFMMLSILCFMRVCESGGAKKREFIGCGAALGFAAATRWIGLGILPILGLIYLMEFKKIKSHGNFLIHASLALFAGILVYIASHIVLFLEGNSFGDIWHYQISMLKYHSSLTETHTYGSEWWGWPVMKRPIWYFFERVEGLVYGILCIGNPPVVWGLIPAAAYLFLRFIQKPNWSLAFVLAGFFSQWLPWAFIGRVKFFHYFYTAMPFAVLAITLVLRDLWESGRTGRTAVYIYAALAVVMFFYWYPLLIGYPISEKYFQSHLWFKSWI